MWWIYFERHNEAASEAIAASDDPGRVARLAYTYYPISQSSSLPATSSRPWVTSWHSRILAGHTEPAVAAVLIGRPQAPASSSNPDEVLVGQRAAGKLHEFATDRERPEINARKPDAIDQLRHLRLRALVVARVE